MFEWDPNKDRLNRRKHGIAFADTFAVFEDPSALTRDDDSARKATKSEVRQYEGEL